jgi:hypothetical protein
MTTAWMSRCGPHENQGSLHQLADCPRLFLYHLSLTRPCAGKRPRTASWRPMVRPRLPLLSSEEVPERRQPSSIPVLAPTRLSALPSTSTSTDADDFRHIIGLRPAQNLPPVPTSTVAAIADYLTCVSYDHSTLCFMPSYTSRNLFRGHRYHPPFRRTSLRHRRRKRSCKHTTTSSPTHCSSTV